MPPTLQHSINLSGKTALITGATHIPGLQIARALGEAGARLMLSDRQPDALEAACADLQASGLDARWVAADGALQADLHKLVSETLQRMGDVDILVNGAGASCEAPTVDPVQTWDQLMALTVRGSFLLSQLVGQHSMLVRGGRIINLLPTAGQSDPALNLAGATARGAVIHATQALAAQWQCHRITVNAVSWGESQEAGESLQGITVLLASDAGAFVTGQCFTAASPVCYKVQP